MKNKFNGVFKNYMESYLEYRESLGKNTRIYLMHLREFDRYTVNTNKVDLELTKEYVEQWLIKKENESVNSLAVRASCIKSFCIYLNMHGIQAYIIDKRNYKSKRTFIPHIYTEKEMLDILNTIKQIEPTVCNKYRSNMMVLIVKVLFCCGLRISEALNIKYNDIDFENKTIKIHSAKNYQERFIVINDTLLNAIKGYQSLFSNLNNDSYLFENKNTKYKYARTTIEIIFKDIVNNSNLNQHNRYRLHDFRHTFAVHNLRNVFLNKEDVNVFLPILMTYMGHQHISSTEYYLRFTADMYPEFIKECETYFDNVIPDIGDIDEY